MSKVLILGDGLLGSELVKQTGWDYLSRKKDGIDVKTFDLWMFKMMNYNIIINCIANTDTYSIDKESHWDVNYKFVDFLITFCNEFGIKLVHISTDYVYVNSVADASENDVPVHDKNWYSYTKLLADGLIELKCKDYLICRCGHKPTPFQYPEAWVDFVGNFDYVDVIAELIIELVKENESGIYNVGTELKNMYELANKTRKIVGIFKPEQVPDDVSMDIKKLKKCLNI